MNEIGNKLSSLSKLPPYIEMVTKDTSWKSAFLSCKALLVVDMAVLGGALEKKPEFYDQSSKPVFISMGDIITSQAHVSNVEEYFEISLVKTAEI